MVQHFSKEELINHFKIHLDKLKDLCDFYDNGKIHFAQEMAVKIRVLFHNSNSSKSLYKQLKLQDVLFVDTASSYDPRNLITHLGLTGIKMDMPNVDIGYRPRGLDSKFKLVSFDNWWDGKKIIVDGTKQVFTRKKIILEVSDTDGGAHVDDGLKEEYYQLSRNNSAGWWIKINSSGPQIPLNDPVPPTIRQITSEVLKSFVQIDLKKQSKLRS